MKKTTKLCLTFVFPPSESWRRRVSFESRYGICDVPATSEEMTLPSAARERLIFVASFSRNPVAPVFDCRSEPAKSTRLSFPTRMCSEPSGCFDATSTVMVRTAWERDDASFMSVRPVVRFGFAFIMRLLIMSTFFAVWCERSCKLCSSNETRSS